MIKKPIDILPLPQNVKFLSGNISMADQFQLEAPDEVSDELSILCERELTLSILASGEDYTHPLTFSQENRFSEQAYKLNITTDRIAVEYGDLAGAYYAIITLKQMKAVYGSSIPCATIEDSPDIPVRGIMVDISRDKVPTLETLYHIVDLMNDLKYNHLELYIEGFSFAYPSYPQVWEHETPITEEEIQQLDRYCKDRFIDLTPNQNTLGHMAQWLARPEFQDLAEFEIDPNAKKKISPNTLNATDPRSLQLIDQMTKDLLPNFTSDLYNVGMDEPYDLGKGKNKQLRKEIGAGRIYLNYVKEIHKIVTAQGKTMLMWGDIITKHPKILGDLPKDIVVLEWGYEKNHPYGRRGKILQKSGHRFYMCPGTSTWNTIVGRTDNMLGNIRNAAENGEKYGAEGLLITDWGDNGHWQPLPVSFPGYVLGGALGWNASSYGNINIARYLDQFVFKTAKNSLGRLIMELGDFYLQEGKLTPNSIATFYTLLRGLDQTLGGMSLIGRLFGWISPLIGGSKLKTHTYDVENLLAFLSRKQVELSEIESSAKATDLVKEELRYAINLLKIGVKLHSFKKQKSKKSTLGDTLAEKLEQELNAVIEAQKGVWLARNKAGGLDRSQQPLKRILSQLRG